MPQDLKSLHSEYSRQETQYKLLSETVGDIIRSSAFSFGLSPIVTTRSKDMRSLLKKCLLYDGPVAKVRDRAGVKVVARYVAEIEEISKLIGQKFNVVSGPDTKSGSYKPGELGYLGTHFHVELKSQDLKPGLHGP